MTDGQSNDVLGEWTASPKALLWRAADGERMPPTGLSRTATHHLSALPQSPHSSEESCPGRQESHGRGQRQQVSHHRSEQPQGPNSVEEACTGRHDPDNLQGVAVGLDAEAPPMPQKPTLAWCETGIGSQSGKLDDVLAGLGGEDEVGTQQFESTAQFTRWLFGQPRGDLNPWVVLVVGWREAKPCAMAVEAACTGDVSQLRPDARRPTLQPASGAPKPRANVAVKQMIIKVGNKLEQEERAIFWARHEGRRMMGGLDIKITNDMAEVQSLVASAFDVTKQDGGIGNRTSNGRSSTRRHSGCSSTSSTGSSSGAAKNIVSL